jgi:2-aminomuconate deaminase
MPTPKNNSVMKAFDILRLLARSPRPLGPQEIARETAATLSTTHRFLLTLEEIGAVSRSAGNLYHLGMLISELGQSAGRDQILTERARVLIEALAEDLGETVSLTLFTNAEMRKVAWHEPRRALVCRERSDFGPAFHFTSVGKLWLARLPVTVCEESLSVLSMAPLTSRSVATVEGLRQQIREARASGIALSEEETELGMVEVSVPLTSTAGEVVGAVTLSAPVSRLDAEGQRRAVAAMRRTAQTITRRVFVKSYTIPGKARPRGSYPHVKRAGPLVFVSGTSSRRPDESFAGVTVFPDGSVYHDTYEQTRETMLNVADILATLALRPEDILSLEAFLTDMGEEARFRQALAGCFDGMLPPVTVVAARALPHPHQAVMIKAVARCDAA